MFLASSLPAPKYFPNEDMEASCDVFTFQCRAVNLGPRWSAGLCAPQPVPSLGSRGSPGGGCLWLGQSPQDSRMTQTGFNLGGAGWKYHPAGGGARHLDSMG